MNSQRRFGIFLIIVGALILLNQTHVFSLTGIHLMGIFSLILGLLLMEKSFSRPQHKGLLSGSFFLFFGLALLVFDCSVRPLFLGAFFLSLGIANLIYFFFSGIFKSINLLMFFLFGATGITMFAGYYNWIDIWQLQDIIETYWPVLLILIGLFILYDTYHERQKRSNQFYEEPFPKEKNSNR